MCWSWTFLCLVDAEENREMAQLLARVTQPCLMDGFQIFETLPFDMIGECSLCLAREIDLVWAGLSLLQSRASCLRRCLRLHCLPARALGGS